MAKAVKSAIKWVGGVIGGGVSTLFGVVGKPILRALTPQAPEIDTSQVTDFQANPDAGVPYAIGITGTAGTYVYATVGEAKNRNILFNTILSGGGPIDGIVGFSAEGTNVVFDGPETPESGSYRHLMWMRTQMGNTPSAALLPPNTLDAGILAEWTPAHKQSGYAVAWLVCGADQKVYSTGVPKPLWKIRGVKVYDWRLDSTYPGGFGPQRINDPSTWAFNENPAVHAVGWCLGRYQNGRRVLGLGCFLTQLEMAKFNEWANVCDANGWKVGGIVYSTDTKWQILKAICQAGGAYPIPLGAKISVIFNAPRVSIATLTGADIDGNPSIVGTQLRRDRFNRAVPRYRSEANGWQIVPAAALEIAEFIAQDNDTPHTKELEWPLVQDVDQATQLAAYGICNSREIGPIELPLIPPWMGLEPGDCITLNEPEFGMTNQKLVILQRSRDLSTGERSISCVTETDSKHPFCLGRSGTPPPLPSLSAIDTLPSAPDPGSWVVSGGTLAGPGGTLPALILTGAVDDPNAIAIVVEYREIFDTDPVTYGDWVSTEWPVSASRIEIGGVKAGANYQVRVRYRYARNPEDPDTNADLGTIIVGGVDAGTVGGLDPYPLIEAAQDAADAAHGIATGASADIAAEITRAVAAEGTLTVSLASLTSAVGANKASADASILVLTTDQSSLSASLLSLSGTVGANKASADGSIATLVTADVALAARASTLEAKSVTIPNLLKNGDGSDPTALRFWVDNGSGTTVGYDAGVGSLFATPVNSTGASKTFQSDPYPTSPGFVHSLSFVGNGGASAGTAQAAYVYFQWLKANGSGSTVSPTSATRRHDAQTWLTTSGMELENQVAPSDAAFYRVIREAPAGHAGSASSRYMVNIGPKCVPFNDLATQRNSLARLSAEEVTRTTETSALAASMLSLSGTVGANKSSADASLLALSTTTSALSTSMLSLSATVGDHDADIDFLAAAQVTTDGKVSAVVGLELTVDGKVSGVRAANDGTVSALVLDFDNVDIEGNLNVRGQLTTGAVAPRAISDSHATFTATTFNVTGVGGVHIGNWQLLQTEYVTISDAEAQVDLLAAATFELQGSRTSGAGGYAEYDVAVYRGDYSTGAVIFYDTFVCIRDAGGLKFPQQFVASWVDEPGAGSFTYNLYARDAGTGTSGMQVGVRNRYLKRGVFYR